MLNAATAIGGAQAARQSARDQQVFQSGLDSTSSVGLLPCADIDGKPVHGSHGTGLARLPGQFRAVLRLPADRSPTPR